LFDIIWIRLKKVKISLEFFNIIMISHKIWLKCNNTKNIVKELHRFPKMKVQSLKYCWNPLYFLDIWNNNWWKFHKLRSNPSKSGIYSLQYHNIYQNILKFPQFKMKSWTFSTVFHLIKRNPCHNVCKSLY
jgi:hypothetical protein